MPQSSILNLSQTEYYLWFPHINIASDGQRPIQNQNVGLGGGPLVPTWINNINSKMYPTEGSVGTAQTIYFPENGTYVIRWTGEGAASITNTSGASNSSDGIYTGGGANFSLVTNGRFTFTNSSPSGVMTLKGSASFDNLVVCLLSEEALYNSGQRLRARFLELIAEHNPKALRMMDAQQNNLTIMGRAWADNIPFDSISFNALQWHPDKKVGEITGTDTYTASSYTGMPATYEHGEFWHGYMENANTATEVTMDVGGRGAKRVIAGYAQTYPGEIFNTGTNSAIRLLTDIPYTFVYDAYFDEILFNPQGAVMGQPIDALIEYANGTGVPAWICIPFFASDAWILALANRLDETYTPDLVYIEFGNEVWNSAGGFLNYGRCRRGGSYLFGLTNSARADLHGYCGYRTRQIEEIMRPVLGSRLFNLLMWQGAEASSAENLTAGVENCLFQNQSTASVPETSPLHPSTIADHLGGDNAAINHVDGVGYGLYYGGPRIAWLDSTWTNRYDNPPEGVTGINDVLAAADNFALGTRAGIMAAFTFMYDTFKESMDSLTHITTGRFAIANDLATEYSKPVYLYEVNHEFDAPSTSWCTGKSISTSYGGRNGLIDQMFRGFRNSPQYERIVSIYQNRFYAFSQSQAWSLYSLSLGPPWAVFPPQTPTSTFGGDTMQEGEANWRSISNFNNGYRSLQLGQTV